VLAVAGTHGKTTTSAMLAWMLEDAGYAPGFLIGGVPMNFGVSARLQGDKDSIFFVIEADEYDTAFFDKRSKFVHYHAKTAILNNLEYDHADIFPDLAAIETQFHHLVRTVPGIGRVIVNGDEAALQRVLARLLEREGKLWRSEGTDWAMNEHDDGTFDVSSKAVARPRGVAADRQAQPRQRAGRDCRRPPRRRGAGGQVAGHV
jgi:UDP-N-acetylmuramate: L-alanyl-gamma-D-glutamyl-meso-diaminopimelate ligase